MAHKSQISNQWGVGRGEVTCPCKEENPGNLGSNPYRVMPIGRLRTKGKTQLEQLNQDETHRRM